MRNVEPEAWNVDFFVEDEGRAPVQVWLDGLPEEVRGKVIARIDLLRKGGPTLDFPYTSQIEGKLREAKTTDGEDPLPGVVLLRREQDGDSAARIHKEHGVSRRAR